jgi:hypothetical protein
MQFSVIYSVDACRDAPLGEFLPCNMKHWDQTEGDEEYKYDYLEGSWKGGQHRKLCALLTREQFEEFAFDLELQAEDTETMGSIGAPGFGYGWAPAIVFSTDFYDAIVQAYVTPLPEVKGKEEGGFDDEDWDRVRRAVINQYGGN